MYLLLDAPFLFAVQIIVYAGAIMVLFLFVIMLLGRRPRRRPARSRLIGAAPARGRCSAVGVRRWRSASRCAPAIGFATRAPDGFDAVNEGGNAQALADGAVPRLLLPVRGDVDPADHRGDRGDGAGAAQVARDHAGGDRRAPRDLDALGPTRARRARTPSRRAAMRTPIAYFLMLSGDPVRDRHRRRADPQERAAHLHVGRAPAERREPGAGGVLAACTASCDGQVLAFFSMVVAAAEVVVGLAIIVSVYRRTRHRQRRRREGAPVVARERGTRADPTRRCSPLADPAAAARRRGDQPVRRQAAGQGRRVAARS